MSEQAYHAIRAAGQTKAWGLAAAVRYCQKRNVPLKLYTLARQLQAMEKKVIYL